MPDDKHPHSMAPDMIVTRAMPRQGQSVSLRSSCSHQNLLILYGSAALICISACRPPGNAILAS